MGSYRTVSSKHTVEQAGLQAGERRMAIYRTIPFFVLFLFGGAILGFYLKSQPSSS